MTATVSEILVVSDFGISDVDEAANQGENDQLVEGKARWRLKHRAPTAVWL